MLCVDMQYAILADLHASGLVSGRRLRPNHGLCILSLTFSIDCDMYRLQLYWFQTGIRVGGREIHKLWIMHKLSNWGRRGKTKRLKREVWGGGALSHPSVYSTTLWRAVLSSQMNSNCGRVYRLVVTFPYVLSLIRKRASRRVIFLVALHFALLLTQRADIL